jgi:hypothetical protein
VYDLVSGEVGPLLGFNLAGGACLYSGSTSAYADTRAGPALGLMRLIKRSINRNSIMNPSNIFSV